MQPSPRSGRGGVVTAPRHQAERQAVSTAGTTKIAQKARDQQSPHLVWVADRLQRQYGLRACFAKLYAEARCANV